MMFSKACEYGLKAMIYLAGNAESGELYNLDQIAHFIGSPSAFTAKVMQKLSKVNLVVSTKGPGGGFKIEPDKLSKINLAQIVIAIDGDTLLTGCGLGLKICNDEKPCPLHNRYSIIRAQLRDMLESTTLLDYKGGLEDNKYFLTR